MGGLHRRLFPDFNSRPSARGDEKQQNSHFDILFQFTPLREGRPPGRATFSPLGDFNSRPSARGDTGTNHLSIKLSEFQFTPLREGRQ